MLPSPTISIIVPTVDGREEYLAAAKAAYAAHTEGYELIVVPNRPTCGEAWVLGGADARGEYIHFSADDLRPLAGWSEAAREVCGRGFIPAPRILNDDGTLQSCGGDDPPCWGIERPTGFPVDFSRIPFMHRSQWDKVLPLLSELLPTIHYYTDNAISVAFRHVGIATGVHRGYAFYHSLAEVSRGAGMSWEERMRVDRERFDAWRSGL